jgi:hypothetical protein
MFSLDSPGFCITAAEGCEPDARETLHTHLEEEAVR